MWPKSIVLSSALDAILAPVPTPPSPSRKTESSFPFFASDITVITALKSASAVGVNLTFKS